VVGRCKLEKSAQLVCLQNKRIDKPNHSQENTNHKRRHKPVTNAISSITGLVLPFGFTGALVPAAQFPGLVPPAEF